MKNAEHIYNILTDYKTPCERLKSPTLFDPTLLFKMSRYSG